MPRTTKRKKYTKRSTKHSRSTKSRGLSRYKKPIRKFGKSINTNQVTTTYQRGYLPFGQRYMCRLPYANNSQVITALGDGTAAAYNFRINSMHDPDQTGVGHQPYQWDQINPMYGRYIIYGCKYVVSFTNPTADGIFVGIGARRELDANHDLQNQSISAIREMKLTTLSAMNNTGRQIKRFSGWIGIHQLFGKTKAQLYNDFNFGSAIETNPVNIAQLQVFVVDPSGLAASVQFTLKLTFYAQLSDYKTPAQSTIA